jgi:hypothetical protein
MFPFPPFVRRDEVGNIETVAVDRVTLLELPVSIYATSYPSPTMDLHQLATDENPTIRHVARTIIFLYQRADSAHSHVVESRQLLRMIDETLKDSTEMAVKARGQVGGA